MNLDQNLGVHARSEIHCWRKRRVIDGSEWVRWGKQGLSSMFTRTQPTRPAEPIRACSARGVPCTCHSKKVLRNVQAQLLFLLSLCCALTKKYGKCDFENLCSYKSEENNPKGKVFTTYVCWCKGQMPEVMGQHYWSLWLTRGERAILLVPTIRPSILVYLASMSADWDYQEFFGFTAVRNGDET